MNITTAHCSCAWDLSFHIFCAVLSDCLGGGIHVRCCGIIGKEGGGGEQGIKTSGVGFDAPFCKILLVPF